MRHWQRSSPEGRRRRDGSALVGPLLVGAGAVVGVVAARAAFDWDDPRAWVPDLVVGLVFVVVGASVVGRRPGAGWLLTATGFAWFAGNFDPGLVYLHRGPLVHLVVAYAGWRPGGRLASAMVVTGYVAALVLPAWDEPLSATILVVALVGVVGHSMRVASGRSRSERATALVAAVVFGLGVVSFAAVTRVVGSGAAGEPMLLAYQAALVAIAVVLSTRLASPSTAAVTDLVVELGESRSATLRDALADVLGDPTLEVGYVSADGSYRDEQGRELALPGAGSSRAATFVEWESRPFAVLVHDSSVLDEPAVSDAVATATRLSAANSTLTAEIRSQLDVIDASRRRLLVAADEQRRRLEAQLRGGVEQRIVALSTELAALRSRPIRSHGEVFEHVERAARHLDGTVDDLRLIASGLHPRDLDAGLVDALTTLAARCPVATSIRVDGEVAVGRDVAAAVYYVCAEALANVAKHALATAVDIQVTGRGDALVVEVVDDGEGGADAMGGSGLGGLVDRVEALGGVLTLASPVGGGTRLVAELPLGHPST